MIAFTVPGDPIPLPRPRVVNGHAYTPKEAQQYKGIVALYARSAGARPASGPVRLTLRFFRASARPCDIDNLAKLVLDALIGTAYADDRQVLALHATKAVDRENPRAEIEIEELAMDERTRDLGRLARALDPKRAAMKRLQPNVRRYGP